MTLLRTKCATNQQEQASSSKAASSSNAATSTAPTPVFVYGTFVSLHALAEILTGYCDEDAVSAILPLVRWATVDDYARYRLRGCRFPGAVAVPGASISGYLVTLEHDWQRENMDWYEAVLFRAAPVQARILGDDREPTGEVVQADMYVYGGPLEQVIPVSWDVQVYLEGVFQGIDGVNGREGDEVDGEYEEEEASEEDEEDEEDDQMLETGTGWAIAEMARADCPSTESPSDEWASDEDTCIGNEDEPSSDEVGGGNDADSGCDSAFGDEE